MNSFLELQQALQSDLNINSDSTLFPLTTVKLALNRSYIKCGALFLWPETESAKKTSSVANREYYDYPNTFRPDSIWKLIIDGNDYGEPIAFRDYLYEKENNIPSGRDRIWSSQWRRYFVYPTPTSDGDMNIYVWGQKSVDTMTNDGDTTIWSNSMPECNEAVVLEAAAILKNKGEDEKPGEFRSQEAKQILVVAWGKIRSSQKKYQKTKTQYNIPDYLDHRTRFSKSKVIGNF